MDDDTRELTIGDRAPNFVLPDKSGRFVMFYERTQGRPVVLLLVPEPEAPRSRAVLAAFRAQYETLEGLGIDIYCLQGGPAGQQEPAGDSGPEDDFLVWRDPAGKILEAYWAGLGRSDTEQTARDQVIALMLDANQRILNVLPSKDEGLAGQVCGFFGSRPLPEQPVLRCRTAPVLIIPNLLPNAWCDRVVVGWSGRAKPARQDGLAASLSLGRSGAFPGLELTSPAQSPIEQPLGPELARPLQGLIGRRLAPELQKAFSFGAFRFAGLAMACREAVVGEAQVIASPSPETGGDSRCFTLMIDITPHGEACDDHDGSVGGLVFPEYGPDIFWPRRGGAVIFASDLLVHWKAARRARCCFLKALLKG